MLYVLGILALAVVVVILLLHFMRARHAADARRATAAAKPAPPPPHEPVTKDEQDYLDSSHISGPLLPGGSDALDTWRNNKRK